MVTFLDDKGAEDLNSPRTSTNRSLDELIESKVNVDD